MDVAVFALLPSGHSMAVPRARTSLGERSLAVAGPTACGRVYQQRQTTGYGQFRRVCGELTRQRVGTLAG